MSARSTPTPSSRTATAGRRSTASTAVTAPAPVSTASRKQGRPWPGGSPYVPIRKRDHPPRFFAGGAADGDRHHRRSVRDAPAGDSAGDRELPDGEVPVGSEKHSPGRPASHEPAPELPARGRVA